MTGETIATYPPPAQPQYAQPQPQPQPYQQPYQAQPVYQQPLPPGPSFQQRLQFASFNRFALILFIMGLVGMILSIVIPSVYMQTDYDGKTYTAIYDFQLDRSSCTGSNCDQGFPDDLNELNSYQDTINAIAMSFFFIMMVGIIFMGFGLSGMMGRYSPKTRQFTHFLCLFVGFIAIATAVGATMTLVAGNLDEVHNSTADAMLGEDNTTFITPMGAVTCIIAFVLLLILFIEFRAFWKTLPAPPQYMGTLRYPPMQPVAMAPVAYAAPPPPPPQPPQAQQPPYGGWQQ